MTLLHGTGRRSIAAGPVRLTLVVGLAALGVAVSLACVAPVRGSGTATTEERNVAPFSEVETNGSIEALITVGPAQRVTITADDNILPLIETTVANGRLTVRTTGDPSDRAPSHHR